MGRNGEGKDRCTACGARCSTRLSLWRDRPPRRTASPTVGGAKQFVEAGGLFAYGANVEEAYRHAAVYVDKILKGVKPADLPIEQPTKYLLAINLQTAKALSLKIPQSLLLRADVIQ
ncbi:MAG: hypothetical protein E6H78_13820 [Betaproteobacteria bacterium]|nr:MAG: hypothetical protein E6H78_13820 [Betaproteobacteria bacterium]